MKKILFILLLLLPLFVFAQNKKNYVPVNESAGIQTASSIYDSTQNPFTGFGTHTSAVGERFSFSGTFYDNGSFFYVNANGGENILYLNTSGFSLLTSGATRLLLEGSAKGWELLSTSNNYFGQSATLGLYGVDTSKITFTAPNDSIIFSSGSPKNGYVWESTNSRGSGEWMPSVKDINGLLQLAWDTGGIAISKDIFILAHGSFSGNGHNITFGEQTAFPPYPNTNLTDTSSQIQLIDSVGKFFIRTGAHGGYYLPRRTINYTDLSAGGGGAGWNLTGNAGTDPALDFVGTTDNEDFNIGRNDTIWATFLKLGNMSFGNPVSRSLYIGILAGVNDVGTSHLVNTGVGYNALRANTTGANNTAFGGGVLESNTTGTNNTAGGRDALANNTIGQENSAWGDGAMDDNIISNDGTAFGFAALHNSTSGFNTAVGSGTLTNVTSSHNTAVGYDAGEQATTGNENTFIGSEAGLQTNGSNNVMIGFFAGKTLFGSDIYLINGDGNFTASNTSINDFIFIGRNGHASQTNTFAVDTNKVWCIGATFGSYRANVSNGDLGISTSGNTLRIKSGSNACKGIAVLSGGTATVSTTAVSSDSHIVLTQYNSAGTNLGESYVVGQTNGVGFTIKNTNVLASDTVKWFFVKDY
jgi:hypothetical protein